MSQPTQIVLALLIAFAVIAGCVAGCIVLQMQANQARIVATLDHGSTGKMMVQQPGEPMEPKAATEDKPQGSIDMGPFTWSHFLTISIFILGVGATALGWLLGQKQDKASCEKRHGAEGQERTLLMANQKWIITALQRIAENGGPHRTKLPDPPSHPDTQDWEVD